jgi:hypothetical protein
VLLQCNCRSLKICCDTRSLSFSLIFASYLTCFFFSNLDLDSGLIEGFSGSLTLKELVDQLCKNAIAISRILSLTFSLSRRSSGGPLRVAQISRKNSGSGDSTPPSPSAVDLCEQISEQSSSGVNPIRPIKRERVRS